MTVAGLSVQLCGLRFVMDCMLAVPVGQVCVVRGLLVLLGLVVFCGFVEMIGCPLMVAGSVMVMLPSL